MGEEVITLVELFFLFYTPGYIITFVGIMTDFQIITLKGLVAHLILFTDQVLVDDNWFTEICVASLTALVIKLSKFMTHHTSEEVSDKLRKIVLSPFHLLEIKISILHQPPPKNPAVPLEQTNVVVFLVDWGWLILDC